MEKQTKTKKAQTDAVPTPDVASVETGEQTSDWNPSKNEPTYVVVRSGVRVSDQEYISPDWPAAIAELGFWQRVVKRFPDGTKVEIVPYEKKKHRVW